MPVLTSRLFREPSVAGVPILTGIPLCSPNIHLQLAAVVDFPNAHHAPRGMARRAVNHRPRMKKSRVRIEQCLESTDDPSVREREHFWTSLLSRSIRRRIWATRASPEVGAATAPRGPMGQKYLASGIRLSMRIWERESPDTQPKAETTANYETAGYVIAGRPNYISKARLWNWNRATLGSCRKVLATATNPGSVHGAGGHHPARGSARPGRKRASRLNHATPSPDCDTLYPTFHAFLLCLGVSKFFLPGLLAGDQSWPLGT